jgi:hypothetical protein
MVDQEGRGTKEPRFISSLIFILRSRNLSGRTQGNSDKSAPGEFNFVPFVMGNSGPTHCMAALVFRILCSRLYLTFHSMLCS